MDSAPPSRPQPRPRNPDVSPGPGSTDRDQFDFEDFFENGGIALHLVGRDGTILHANKAELDLLGYSADDYIGRKITDVHADQDAIDDIMARLSRGEALQKYPARLRARDGSIKHVQITSSVQFRDDEFVNTRCFTVDVTALVDAREEIRRKDERFSEVLNALPAAIYTTDAEGTIVYCNRAAAELAGRAPEIGRDKWCVTFRLFTPDGKALPHDQCPMATTLKENRPVRGVEAVAQRPDGTFVPFLPFPTPIRDADGKLIGAVNMLVDITDRKRAEDGLRRTEEFNRRILQSSQDCIKVLDLAGKMLSINDAGCGYLEIDDMDAVLGADYLDLWREEYRAAAEAALAAARRGEIGRFTAHYETPSGKTSWWDEIITPITGLDGTPEQLLIVSRDITEIKAAGEQREGMIKELDHRVKNTLAAVQSLANATLPSSPEVQTYFGRLRALAEAHRLLAETRWDGGCLETIVTTTTGPYWGRVHLDGGGVRLTPRAAQTMCIVVHELATNAAKHGALSKPDGSVEVSWTVFGNSDDGSLRLTWIEAGGPPAADPSHRGFGTRFIQEAVAYELNGRTELNYLPEGLRCAIELPWAGNIRKTRSAHRQQV